MNASTPENSTNAESMSAFLPLTLLGISFLLLLLFQISLLVPQRAFLQKVIAANGQRVEQSKQVQTNLQKLVMDLVETAKTDSDAQALVTKYGIQVTGTSAPNPLAAPGATK